MSTPANNLTLPQPVKDWIQEALRAAAGIHTPEERFWALYKVCWLQTEIGDGANVGATLLKMSEAVLAMSDAGERPGFYLYVVEQQVKAGDLQGARASTEAAFMALEAITDEEDEFHIERDSALVDLVECQAGTQDIAQARRTLAGIVSPSYQAKALTKIAAALGDAGRLEDALLTLDEAEQLTTLADPYAIQFIGAAQIALSQYEAAQRTALRLPDDQARNGILLDLVREYLKQQDRDAAWSVLNSMSYPLYICFALHDIGSDQIAQGSLPAARATLQDLRARSLALDDKWRLRSLTGIVELQVVTGDHEGARETLDAMLPSALSGTDLGDERQDSAEQNKETTFALTVGLAALGDLDAARLALNHLQQQDRREEALVKIATYQANRGKITDATRTAEEIQGAARRVDVLTSLALAFLRPQYRDGFANEDATGST